MVHIASGDAHEHNNLITLKENIGEASEITNPFFI